VPNTWCKRGKPAGLGNRGRLRRTGARTGAVITAILALAAAGCGSASSTASGAAATHHPMASHSHAMAGLARFGSDCGMVPATGMGSFHSMSMMHSTAELAKILKHHIVNGRVTPAELAHGMALRTLEGGSLQGSKMGSVYEVNRAQVICGNIQTANATVYVINKVLVPMH